jgi:hypothetical protein
MAIRPPALQNVCLRAAFYLPPQFVFNVAEMGAVTKKRGIEPGFVFVALNAHASRASTVRRVERIMRGTGGSESRLFRRAGRRRAEETKLNRDAELGLAGWDGARSHPALMFQRRPPGIFTHQAV